MKTPTQADRLFAYLRRNPGATSLDIIRDCHIVNTTGRISDLRARGVNIDCRKQGKLDCYYLIEPRIRIERRPLISAVSRRFFNIGTWPESVQVTLW